MENFKDWIPFFQTLIWPVFILVLIIILWKPLKELLNTVQLRIKQGAEFKVGPQGISLGQAPKLENENSSKKISGEKLSLSGNDINTMLPEHMYLIHGAELTNYPNKGDYLIRVQLHCDNQNQLENVSKVVYHLHSSYYNRERETTSVANNFELQFNAYGQFHLRAEVFFKNLDKPVNLYRYLNF